MNKSKKIISIIAAATLAFSTVALAGCDAKNYAGENLPAGYDKTAAVSSNGGFAVEKGNYVYFINGSESNTADNTYGDVVKGSLMCISKKDLADLVSYLKFEKVGFFPSANFLYVYKDEKYSLIKSLD